MFVRYQSQSTVKRKQKLLKDLIECFGREYKDLITSYIDQSDDYFEEGQSYHDIFISLQSQISSQLSSPSQNFSTEYRRSSIKPVISLSPKLTPLDLQSKSKSSVSSQAFLSQMQKFNLQKSALEAQESNQKFSSFLSRPSILIQSKEDELRALQAIQEREEQSKLIEQSRDKERLLIAKGNKEYQAQQIREKYEIMRRIREDERKYAEQVGQRLRAGQRIELDEREREIDVKKRYKMDLLKQLREKDQEKMVVRSLEDRMKYFMTPEPQSPASPASPVSVASECFRCVSPYSQSKSSKFLAQYGNLVLSKNK